MSLRYISVCSGIEAASVAWHPLGFEPVAFSEIEPFPSAVLAARWPDVPNLGDMTQFQQWPNYAIDILVGGTPCQSFSVAGLRKGLADPRGNLALTYLAIAARYRPEWILWENVPGVLSDKGNAFGCFLAGLAELGYGWSYRVLDAQHFGVPQRRRRVFVVGHLGDWRRAAAVLFERHSLQGHHPPSRKAGQRVAGTISARTEGGGVLGTDFELSGGLTAAQLCPTLRAGGNRTGATDRQAPPGTDVDTCESLIVAASLRTRRPGEGGIAGDDTHLVPTVSPALNTQSGSHHAPDTKAYVVTHSLRGEGFDASEDGTGRGTPLVPVAFRAAGQDGFTPSDISPPIAATDGGGAGVPVCFDTTQITSKANRCNPQAGDPCHPLAAGAHPPAMAFQTRIARNGRGQPSEVVPALNGSDAGETSDMRPCVSTGTAVRRLTPRECERLQGFEDDYTLITVRGKPAADGPRYKALGNSMAVPVIRWIGERIAAVHALPRIDA